MLGVFGIAARVKAREAEVPGFCVGVKNALCGEPLSLKLPSGIDAKPQIAIAAANMRAANRVMEGSA
jgi:hypothetical protein